MTNTTGPRTKKRRVLLEVVHSVLLYGAEIWAHILKQKTYRRKMAGGAAAGALRVACAYRTVSEAAILVIAGAAPIDLLAFKRVKPMTLKGRMGLQDTPMCKYCPDKIDDAEHTFFKCVRWKDYRSSTEEIIGTTLSPESSVTYMLKTEDNWSAVAAYAQRVLKRKPQKGICNQ
ncbi:uncharacterized protein LOC123266055 [Cotesia glomerata]|uniref:uncharacterized protein LOC123266055 n=1 Tax=Cotesia glomerata TaxID=32391 RepID=UPI001D0337EF|nr:uncharacterized protein LOC123266055 [Cotesia glomerata]